MENKDAKALTEALTGKVLPPQRAKLAAAAYGSLTASLYVAKEKEATPAATTTIKHLIALTASYLVKDTTEREAKAYALDMVKAAGYIVEGLDMHLNSKVSEAFTKYIYTPEAEAREAMQRAVSYGELAAIEEAFIEYTKGVTFRDEEAREEALSDYTTGYMNYPEAEGGVDDYTAKVKPYLAPGITL